ncbi:MAG: hypothetical protein H6Q04_239 [Acidobacteria bacterium]|nr:hypothetical protein [Acidobacteriota bacterium]
MRSLNIAFLQRRNTRREALRSFSECLREAGHHVFGVREHAYADWQDADLLWIQGNANWFPAACRQLERVGTQRPRVLIWHTEPLPPRPGSGWRNNRLHLREIVKIVLRHRQATDPYTNAARLKKLWQVGLPDVLAISARSRQEFLTSCGIKSHFVPLGYAGESQGRLLGLQRDIDVLFLGTMQVPRRRRLVSHLRRSGIEVQTKGSWKSLEAWGENRTLLLNRTKILLSLQRHPGEFTGMRLILGMSNGAMVISEPIDQPDPYIPGRHYIEAPTGQMPAVVRYYLEHPDERERVAMEGHRLMKDLTMQASVRRILELVEALEGCPRITSRT